MKKQKLTSVKLAESIVRGIQEVKGMDIIMLDLRKVDNAVTDFFVICHADSNTHVAAITDSIEKLVREETGEKPWHREGFQNSEWILMDYVNVVAHVFISEKREFYNLEELWADAKQKSIESVY